MCPSLEVVNTTPGNLGHGARLGRAAARGRAFGTRLRSNMPHLATVSDTQGREAATNVRIDDIAASVGLVGLPRALDIGYGREDALPIGRHAPLHTAISATQTDARLPQNFALFRRIECPHD